MLLARSLASLDVLSAGRLDIGLGLGWSADEYEAVGVPQRDLAARQEELLDVLDTVWADGTVCYQGSHLSVAPTRIRPKPVQSPRPPILLAAYTPAGLERAGRRAQGWDPRRAPPRSHRRHVVHREKGSGSGGPRPLGALARRASEHQAHPETAGNRPPYYHGSIEQIAADVRGAFELGAHQVILDLQGTTTTVAECLDVADAVIHAGDLRAAA